MELIKQQSLMYQQQNAIKWGNSVWSDGVGSAPSRSLREIQEEEEQKKKEVEVKKKEAEETKKREDAEKRKQEEDTDLLWIAQQSAPSTGAKLSLREIQEQERKREKALKEKEAAKVSPFPFHLHFPSFYSYFTLPLSSLANSFLCFLAFPPHSLLTCSQYSGKGSRGR
jgi:hypothetical protein